jgi:hypothetical protein
VRLGNGKARKDRSIGKSPLGPIEFLSPNAFNTLGVFLLRRGERRNGVPMRLCYSAMVASTLAVCHTKQTAASMHRSDFELAKQLALP